MTKTAGTCTPSISKILATLKAELQLNDDKLFEEMSAELFSRLLDGIAITVSKTGSQFGADAGTAGLRGRRLRIECKRYRDKTRLDPRGLAGEVMEAVVKDPLLEAWVLMATKKVSETERNLANATGEKLGVPIVVIDWTLTAAGAGISSLAALCASWPEVVERHMGKAAADAARSLTPHVGAAVDNLRKDLQFWNIGFRTLRENSIKQLRHIWRDSAEARAVLNQDAAGGRKGVHLVSRVDPMRQLDEWWMKPVDIMSAAVVTGLEGVGKTWVALDWANTHSDDLPIVVVLPASGFLNGYLSEAGLRELLMKSLRATAKSSLSDEYWRARVSNLVQRPITEGPAILLIVDGLNQQPHIEWSALTAALQGEALSGKLRFLATTRRTHFEKELRGLGALLTKPAQVSVGPYDDAELDELLSSHGMTRAEMHPALIKLASIPRLFPLVHRLKDNVALQSEASVPRLLFEYWRDVLQQRQQSTLTEDNWVTWLVERAKVYHQKILQTKKLAQPESFSDVAKSLDSPHLSRDEVARRLSEVVDGGLFQKAPGGFTTKLVLQQDAAILGLGLALIESLSSLSSHDFNSVQSELENWLEPVAAIDQVTDVLRAALAVLSAMDGSDGDAISDELLVAWMHAQNPSVSFEQDVKVFGDAFPRSMLAVVERSNEAGQAGAHFFAVQTLRALAKDRTEDWRIIAERMEQWAGWLLLPTPDKVADPGHYAKRNQDELIVRIGSVMPGTKVVLGSLLRLDYRHTGDVATAIPAILEGHDLPAFAPVFRAAAVREAVQVDGHSRCWSGLVWLALVGGADEAKTRECLQRLAEEMLMQEAEAGVHPRLRNRVAALLLRLSGDGPKELQARTIDERFGGGWNYSKDYLASPGGSYFMLERRHLEDVLKDATLGGRRLEKMKPFLGDPNVILPKELLEDVEVALREETFIRIDEHGQATAEEHRFEASEVIAARFVPVLHAETARRRLRVLAGREGEQKYWAALRAPQLLLSAGINESAAFTGLRTRTKLNSSEKHANTWCLQVELLHKSVEEQLAVLLSAKDFYFTISLMSVVRSATATQLLQFLQANPDGTRASHIVLEVMAHQNTVDADLLAEKLVEYLVNADGELRTIAFVALSSCSPEICGRKLLAINWKFDVAEPISAHYGSLAVAVASHHFDFHEVLPMVAPWRWLDAACIRGKHKAELLLASKSLLTLIGSATVELPELNALLSMRTSGAGALARISVSELPPPDGDGLEGLRRMSQSQDEIARRMQELAIEAAASIQKIRNSGHSLYLHAFSKQNVREAYLAARGEWDALLRGADTLAPEFVTRVRAAEGLYSALCEVLLEENPARGVALWRALKVSLRTEVRGKAGIPELLHMVFRAPDSADVSALRDWITSFSNTSTDKDLLDLVIAAQFNGKDEWLDKLVKLDAASPRLWRRKRAIVLNAFRSYPDIDKLDWPAGEKNTSWQFLDAGMAAWTNRGVFARYWWEQFIFAATLDEAFAAWTVFLSCADRRAHVWMDSIVQKTASGGQLDRLKRLHVLLNRDLLERSLRKQEENSPSLANKLFGYDAPASWLQLGEVKS